MRSGDELIDDAVDGGDGVDVLETAVGFDLRDQQCFLVCGLHRVEDVAAGVIVVGDSERRPATAGWRVLRGSNDRLRLFDRFDHRKHQTHRAAIEHAGDDP